MCALEEGFWQPHLLFTQLWPVSLEPGVTSIGGMCGLAVRRAGVFEVAESEALEPGTPRPGSSSATYGFVTLPKCLTLSKSPSLPLSHDSPSPGG